MLKILIKLLDRDRNLVVSKYVWYHQVNDIGAITYKGKTYIYLAGQYSPQSIRYVEAESIEFTTIEEYTE